MRIVIGYDGSASADAALADLPCAGLPPSTDALIVGVLDEWPRLETCRSKDELLDRLALGARPELAQVVQDSAEMRRLVREAAGTLRSLYPQWNVAGDVRTGSPAAMLVETADECAADLIILGARVHSAVGRWIHRSVSDAVMLTAHCSVRIGRCAHHPSAPESAPVRATRPRLLLYAGTGRQQDCDTLAEALSERQWPWGTEVRIVTIRSAADMPAPVLDSPDALDRYGTALSDLVNRLSSRGTCTTTAVEPGDLSRILTEQADLWGAGCIFMDRNQRQSGWFSHAPLAETIAARARCSVEMIVGASSRAKAVSPGAA